MEHHASRLSEEVISAGFICSTGQAITTVSGNCEGGHRTQLRAVASPGQSVGTSLEKSRRGSRIGSWCLHAVVNRDSNRTAWCLEIGCCLLTSWPRQHCLPIELHVEGFGRGC